MRFKMSALGAALLAACAAEKPAGGAADDPAMGRVDARYFLELTGLRMDCEFKDEAADLFGASQSFEYDDRREEADFLLHTDDDLVDLRHGSDFLPGSLTGFVKNLRLDDGVVDFDGALTGTQISLAITIAGTITPAEMVIDFEESISDASFTCVSSGHAEGRARPMSDPKALDGSYMVEVRVRSVCSPPDLEGPASYSIERVEVFEEADDRHRLRFPNALTEFTTRLGEDGELFYLDDAPVSLGGTDSVRGIRAEGTLQPDELDFYLKFGLPELGEDCFMLAYFEGRKLVARRGAHENDYRIKFSVEDDCLGYSDEEYGSANLYATGDWHGYQLRDDTVALPVKIYEGRLYGDVGVLETDAYHLDVQGEAAPPKLNYTTVLEQFDPRDGGTCTVTRVAEGEVRYVFE